MGEKRRRGGTRTWRVAAERSTARARRADCRAGRRFHAPMVRRHARRPCGRRRVTEAHGTVLNGTGGIWVVRTTEGMTVDASLRGRLKQENAKLKLAVGDEVTIARDEREGAWSIERFIRVA